MLGDDRPEVDSAAADGDTEDESRSCAVELASPRGIEDVVNGDEGAVVEASPPAMIVLEAYPELYKNSIPIEDGKQYKANCCGFQSSLVRKSKEAQGLPFRDPISHFGFCS